MVGGGFYEPILAVIPPEDQREQIERHSSYLERHFGEGHAARGSPNAWEPQMPSILATSHVNYTLVDDFHFLAAGFEPSELFGLYR
jgi:alpha-amylase